MPTQKDCKYSQLSQLSQISGQIAFVYSYKIREYVRRFGKLSVRNDYCRQPHSEENYFYSEENYFSGIFSSTATRNFQVSATEAMFTRSSGE